jgi:hypothetical protein
MGWVNDQDTAYSQAQTVITETYRGPERRRGGHDRRGGGGWHLTREFNLAHAVFTLAIAGSMIYAGHRADVRMSRLEILATDNKATIMRNDLRVDNLIGQVNASLQRIDDKLDRLIERNGNDGHKDAGQAEEPATRDRRG